jgi:uncharacterized protein (TIGR02145 family)
LTLSINSVVSLSVTNCDSSNADAVTINIDPIASGVFKSACQNISVAANTPGYSLLVKSSSTDLLYQNPTTITPAPKVPSTTTGTIASPATLPNDTWGFAVEDNGNFDTTYAINNANNKYALLPITDQTIYQTDKALGETPTPLSNFKAYYGAKLTLNTIAGEYKTTITYSAIGAEVPEPPEIACVSGSQFKGSIGNIINAATATASWVVGDTGIAIDTRNNQRYCIGKLVDDNIWMLNNLKIIPVDVASKPSASDPNINLSALASVDTATTGLYTYSYTVPQYYDTNGGTDITADNFYGYLYNWCATMGATTGSCTSSGTYPSDLSGNTVDSGSYDPANTSSICPAGWRLPRGDISDLTTYEFDILNAKMAGYADNGADYQSNHEDYDYYGSYNTFGQAFADNWLFGGQFRGVLSGSDSNGASGPGVEFALWTSQPSGYSGASGITLFIDSPQDFIYMEGGNSRHKAYAVRCILQ